MCSVSRLGVELLADVLYDLGHKFVQVVKLVHEEGVLLVWICGNVLQFILRGPGNANGVSDHTWKQTMEKQTSIGVVITSNTKNLHKLRILCVSESDKMAILIKYITYLQTI